LVKGFRGARLVIVVLLVALLGTSYLSYSQYRQRSALEAKRDAAVSATRAAKKAMVSMVSYDYRTVDQDFQWVETAGTKSFQKFFSEASTKSKQLIVKLEATATGTVIDAAAKPGTKTKVEVLMFVDQLIKSKDDPEGKLDQTRVSMWMVKQDGRWLVSKVLLRDRPTLGSLPN